MRKTSDSKKKAKGTHRESRDKHVPQVIPFNDLTPPVELSEGAKAEWNEIAPTLSKQKMLSVTDRKLLMAYCSEMAKYQAFNKEMELSGVYLLPLKDGKGKIVNYMKNPLCDLAMRSLEAAHKIGIHFGLTPASRGKINIGENKADTPEAIAAAKFAEIKGKGKIVKMTGT